MSTSETLMQQYRKEKEDEFQWQGVLKADRGFSDVFDRFPFDLPFRESNFDFKGCSEERNN